MGTGLDSRWNWSDLSPGDLLAKRKQRTASAGANLIPAALMGAAVLGGAGVWFLGSENEPTGDIPVSAEVALSNQESAGSGSAVAQAGTTTAGLNNTDTPTGKPYRPGVSDKELAAFLERLRAEQGDEAEAQLTEPQIIAIMGEPTTSEPPITGRKNGQVFTVKELRWEHHTPAKDYSTVVSFINGRFAGGVIGLEVTPQQLTATGSAPGSSSSPTDSTSTQPSAPTGPLEEWVLGVWEGKLAESFGIPARTLRVEFRKSGELRVTSVPRVPDNFEATWRVERTEGNNLWILFDVTRVNGQPAENPGRSILITRQTDGIFTSRAFQPPDAVEFRRVKE
jgi:hypothetical protein